MGSGEVLSYVLRDSFEVDDCRLSAQTEETIVCQIHDLNPFHRFVPREEGHSYTVTQ